MAYILVIDDDPIVRSLATSILEQHDHTVIAAADGRVGLTMFQSREFDLVMTDIVMPEMEGIAMITAIRRLKHGIPILAMSGSQTVGRYGDHLHAASLVGATATLRKPFTPDLLMREVDQILRR